MTGETEGRLFLMEHQRMEPHGGPNLHLHLNQDEWFYVIGGEVAFQVGEQRLHLHAGESVLAPRRVPHTFASVGAVPGRMLIGFGWIRNPESGRSRAMPWSIEQELGRIRQAAEH